MQDIWKCPTEKDINRTFYMQVHTQGICTLFHVILPQRSVRTHYATFNRNLTCSIASYSCIHTHSLIKCTVVIVPRRIICRLVLSDMHSGQKTVHLGTKLCSLLQSVCADSSTCNYTATVQKKHMVYV